MGIKSVVEDGVSGLLNEAMCCACEMASVWMQSELSQNQTQERILAYAAEVSLEDLFWTKTCEKTLNSVNFFCSFVTIYQTQTNNQQ